MFSTRLGMVASLWRLRCTKSVGHSPGGYASKNLCLSSSSKDDELSKKRTEDITLADNLSDNRNIQTDSKLDCESSPSLKIVSVMPEKGPPPEPPVTCCMTGCANCVWIAYAEELKEYYGDVDDEKILDQIEDPSLKAFIKLELGIK